MTPEKEVRKRTKPVTFVIAVNMQAFYNWRGNFTLANRILSVDRNNTELETEDRVYRLVHEDRQMYGTNPSETSVIVVGNVDCCTGEQRALINFANERFETRVSYQ